MRALVLGGTGHIGAHVVRALLARGWAVRATYRNPRFRFVLDGTGAEAQQLDVTESTRLEAAVDGCDAVIDCAGFYPSWTARREAAIACGVRHVRAVFDVLAAHRLQSIVYTSSAATIRATGHQPATESDREPWPLPAWRPLYATVKLAMEREVERYVGQGLPIAMTHPSVCLGEFDAHPFSGRLILLYAKQRLPVWFDDGFNLVYTGDVAQAVAAAAESPRPGQHYLLSQDNTTLERFGKLVAQLAGVPPPRWRIPNPIIRLAGASFDAIAALSGTEPAFSGKAFDLGRAPHWLDSTKAQRDLGMPQTSTEEAIRRALAWFRKHGYCR